MAVPQPQEITVADPEDLLGKQHKRSDLLGHYKLLEKIAQGGMAEIYKAETYDPNGLKRLVVIKRILPHISSQQEFVDMLIDEAKIAVQFNHGNIAQIYDLGKVGKDYFIVMEYVEGKTLQQIFKRAEVLKQKIPIPYCLYFIAELCGGLAHMHRKTDEDGRSLGVVHRDISPQNIIVTGAGTVKIIDFGIAKAQDKLTVTESGVLKGKFAYMSPEQAVGDTIDARSDIFAAGIILWELLSGMRLFRKQNNKETLAAVKKGEVPAVVDATPAISKALDKVVRKALARPLRKRYADAGELQEDLMRLLYREYPEFKPLQIGPYLDGLFSTQAPPAAVAAVKDEDKTRKERVVPSHASVECEETVNPRPPAVAEKKEKLEIGEDTQRVRLEDIDMSPVLRPAEEKEEEALESTRIVAANASRPNPPNPPLLKGEEEDFAVAQENSEEKKGAIFLEEEKGNEAISPSLEKERSLFPPLEKGGQGGFENSSQWKRVFAIILGALFLILASIAGLRYLSKVWRSITADQPQRTVISSPQPQRGLLPPPKPKQGSLVIESEPAGADIFLEDKQTGKKTPATFEKLPADVSYRVGLHADGKKYVENAVTVTDGESKTLRVTLESNPGRFSFVTDPTGATVYLNGEIIGQTPILNYEVTPGTIVELRYRKEGFEEWSEHFKVFGGEQQKIFRLLHSNFPNR